MNTTAGYSGTPLGKKLGIRAGERVALLGAPVGFERALGRLPDGVRLAAHARGQCRRVVLFVTSRTELDRRLGTVLRALGEGGALWVAWPKRASGVPTDLVEDVVRASGLARGLVDYKVCAIDATWSGLCFARRRGDRGGSSRSGRRRGV